MSHAKAQPTGLYMLFMTEMWERFSFYAMRALLVLYMTTSALQGGLEWTNASALQLYSYYLGLAYAMPVVGGWIADSWLGQRRSVILGGVLMAIGHLLMVINDLQAFYCALIFIALGNGFFKPNVTTMLGGLYDRNDVRRDAGYAIFYMGINVGGILAGLSSAYFSQTYGFDYGFAAATFGMVLGLFIFWMAQDRYLQGIGEKPLKLESRTPSTPLTLVEKHRMGVIAVLSIAIVFFITAFDQAGGLLNLYANQWTDRHWKGTLIPAALFQSLNPLFVVLFSPIFSWIWTSLGAKNPSASLKVALGMLLSGTGFILLWLLTPCDIMETCQGCHSFWLLPFYALVTAGEICILPVVWSAVSKLAPKQYGSSLMAIALFAIGLGGWLAGQLASYVDDIGPKAIFATICCSLFAMSLIMVILTPWLKKWSHGVD